MKRRDFSIALAAGLSLASLSTRAQAFPDKPVKLIVPFAPGSSPDQVNRMFGNELGQVLGRPLVIDNKPGANGITGTIAGLGEPADGYTLVSINVGTLAINPSLFPKQKYYYQQTGAEALPAMSDEQLVQSVRSEQAKWGALVKRSGASNI